MFYDSLEAFCNPPGYERRTLQPNSTGELVVVDTSGIPTRPHSGPRVENTIWTTKIVRSPTRTVQGLYGLGAGADTFFVSQIPETFVTYMIPLKHFTSTPSNVIVGPNTQSIGPSSTFSLQMAHHNMVPRTTNIPTGNVVVNQAPIGTPLSSRPILSLPPRYHDFNPFIAIPTQFPSGASRLSAPPGYNLVVGYVPTPSQVLFGGSYTPFQGGSGSSGSNLIGHTHHLFTLSYQILIASKSYAGGQPQFGVQTQVGHHLRLEDNLRLGLIIHNTDRTHQIC
jgi:hypothetical protein